MYDSFIVLVSILVASFYLLLKSSDYLVSSASSLGRKFGISTFVIGLTFVAVGTSLPELFTAVFGITLSDGPSFVLGTVIGSNISNILLIFGLLLLFSNTFSMDLSKRDLLFFGGSVIALIFVVLSGIISFFIGGLFLCGFVLYMYLSVAYSSKKEFIEEAKEVEGDLKEKTTLVLFGILVLSLFGLNLASRGVVYTIEELGILFSIPLEFLTLTTVAFATSLPELMVTYSAAKKNTQSLAIGNLIGSNISNILLIVGFSGVISYFLQKPLVFDPIIFYPSLFMLAISSALFLSLFYKNSSYRFVGYFFIFFYLLYIVLIF